MSGLRFPAPAYRTISATLLAAAPLESCGVAYSVHDPRTGTWIVGEVEEAKDKESLLAFLSQLGIGPKEPENASNTAERDGRSR